MQYSTPHNLIDNPSKSPRKNEGGIMDISRQIGRGVREFTPTNLTLFIHH
ncbi:conserved hypothetical protein [Vibrio owensii]|nr:conserved hypothetical protein [Vibrio owensii]CAH1550212.1 conserved hypothetical protein [Vibrio owensii]